MSKELKKFYVLNWDSFKDTVSHYDVLPYFRDAYKNRVKSWKRAQKSKRFQKNVESLQVDISYYKAPETRDEFKKFILDESRYMFWAKCEYEMICHGWPVEKKDYKLDVHEQVKMNIDVIIDILIEEFKLGF